MSRGRLYILAGKPYAKLENPEAIIFNWLNQYAKDIPPDSNNQLQPLKKIDHTNIAQALPALLTLSKETLFSLLSKKDPYHNNLYMLAIKQNHLDVLNAAIQLYQNYPELLLAAMIESPKENSVLPAGRIRACIFNSIGYKYEKFYELHHRIHNLIHQKSDSDSLREIALSCAQVATKQFTSLGTPIHFFSSPQNSILNEISAEEMQWFFDKVLSFLLTQNIQEAVKERLEAIVYPYQVNYAVMSGVDPITSLKPIYKR